MNNILTNYMSQIMLACFLALAAWLGVQVKNLYDKYVTNEIKQSVCRTVVRTVEQLYKDLHGEEKLKKAMGRASVILAQYGIKIDEYELMSIIEAAVNEFNKSFKKTDPDELAKYAQKMQFERDINSRLMS